MLDPIIMIVEGDLAFTQSPQFFGMVYVMGDITSNGNTEIQGALAQEAKPASVAVKVRPLKKMKEFAQS